MLSNECIIETVRWPLIITVESFRLVYTIFLSFDCLFVRLFVDSFLLLFCFTRKQSSVVFSSEYLAIRPSCQYTYDQRPPLEDPTCYPLYKCVTC